MADIVEHLEKLTRNWKALVPVVLFVAGGSFWFGKTIYEREVSTLKTERDAARTENSELKERLKVAAPTAGAPAKDEGPLLWSSSIEMEGGPALGRNVFSLRLHGYNSSEREVTIKRAEFISSIDGKVVPLKIIAGSELLALDQVRSIQPKTKITLVALFGPPDPAAPGKILGLDPKEFADRWRRFIVEIDDDVRKYNFPINENIMAAFLPTLVGPQVLKK